MQETNANLDEIVKLAKQLQVCVTLNWWYLAVHWPFCIILFDQFFLFHLNYI